MSVLLVACNNVNAQTLAYFQSRKSVGVGPQIKVGNRPADIQFNKESNKIYVANYGSNSVSIIDSDSGITKNIRVGVNPRSIAIDDRSNKVFVANLGSDYVSVIDGYNDSKIKNIGVGDRPENIVYGKLRTDVPIGVANSVFFRNGTVSVINGTTNTVIKNITVGEGPRAIAIDADRNMIYVANYFSNSVSVIDGTTHTKEPHDIRVGGWPSDIVLANNKIYVSNELSNSVSVIDGTTHTKEPHDIRVGLFPIRIAYDPYTHMIYVANFESNTISVIDGSSNKVAAGVIFNVSPPNSCKIICNSTRISDKFIHVRGCWNKLYGSTH